MAEPAPVYVTNWGPLDGPILGRDAAPALGIFVGPVAAGFPVGMAFPAGLVPHRRGPATTFRLMVGGVELEGRWLCDRRAFVRLGEAAEEC